MEGEERNVSYAAAARARKKSVGSWLSQLEKNSHPLTILLVLVFPVYHTYTYAFLDINSYSNKNSHSR